MKRSLLTILAVLLVNFGSLFSQVPNDTTFYLLTCDPGTETYSVYGHSALRVVMPGTQSDMVYNWGVFDFNTPNFAWKFAKGRLDYMLGVYPYNRFLQDYMIENRAVISQTINLEPVEKLRLMLLLQENMKPENRLYRYDFFYDDCSTRIRDLLEKILGDKLIYPPDQTNNAPTFREKIGSHLVMYPWLKMGTDLLMGTPGERKTSFRDRMFLPEDLQRNLTQAVVNRDRRMVPLVQSAVTILDFPPPDVRTGFYATPIFIFTLLFILLIVISAWLKNSPVINYIDIAIFLAFSVLSLLMIIFNFFTDHLQMRLNLSMIWFNPFIIFCLYPLITGKKSYLTFRLVFFPALLFIPLIIIIPNALNSSFVPVIFILLLRSSARSGFQWNPLNLT
jgi:hypothetical protein